MMYGHGCRGAAVKEMSSTVADIAANSERARATAGRASTQVQAVNAMIHRLGDVAQGIGVVTETINHISAQNELAGPQC